MIVNVENGHARDTCVARRLRRNRRLIDEAISAKIVGPCMLPGRTAQAVAAAEKQVQW
jgi:hypothetical protein